MLLPSRNINGNILTLPMRSPRYSHRLKCWKPVARPTTHHLASNAVVLDSTPRVIGDYEIIRELGRGGMGVVYEAMHGHMRRRVALKVLPKGVAQSGTNVARFLLEARSAGQLHHTNIVPIFEAGEADGFHFYAMQFIQGQNLDLVIDEIKRLRTPQKFRNDPTTGSSRLEHDKTTVAPPAQNVGPNDNAHPGDLSPMDMKGNVGSTPNIFDSADLSGDGPTRGSYFKRVAALGLQVADALAYAHHHKVIHRDIKPSNLILDTDGVVWITDFGLAKQDDDGLTQTGDIVGTLRYMAPERFKGRTDEGCDIYGLGLAIYELSTLTNAFDALPRARLIEQITQQVPEPPRSIAPSIPRDLETIILKAIDPIPERRYPTAMSLAEDLQAFIADRPIRARRVSNMERVWRLCRRNPVTAILTAASLSMLLAIAIGASFFSIKLSRQSKDLKSENARAGKAEQEAQQAAYHASLGLARSLRRGRLPGQHFESLDAIRRATGYLSSLPLDSERRQEESVTLRSEAAAALSLTDLNHIRDFGNLTTRWWSVCVSQDRTLYAQPTDEGEIIIAQTSDDAEQYRIPSIGDSVWVTCFSPDSDRLAAIYHSNPKKFVIWQITDNMQIFEHSDHRFEKFGFAPDDVAVAMLGNDLLVVEDGKQPGSHFIDVAPENQKVVCHVLTCHPTKKLVAISLDVYELDDQSKVPSGAVPTGQVQIVNLKTEELQILPTIERVGALSWTGDDQLAIGYHNGECELRNLHDPANPLRRFEGHTSRVTKIQTTEDERTWLTYSWDGSLRIWDVESQHQLTRLDGFNVIASSRGSLQDDLAFWRNEKPQMWRLHRGRIRRNLKMDSPWTSASPQSSVIHPRLPSLAITATGEDIELWDVCKDVQLGTLPRIPTGLWLSNDGESLMTCSEAGIEHWPIATQNGQPSMATIGPPELVNGQATGKSTFFDRQTWATIEGGGRLSIFLDGGATKHDVSHRALSSMCFSPDGKWIATFTWHGLGVKIWDVASGQLVQDLIPDSPSARGAFTPDGRHFVVNGRRNRYVWTTDSWKLIHELKRTVPDGWSGRVFAASDNRTAVMNHSRNRLELFDLIEGRTIVILEPSDVSPRTAGCFSAKGDSLVTFDNEGMEIWDIHNLRSELSKLGLDWSPPARAREELRPITISIRK